MTQKKRQIEEETVQSGDRWIWGIYIALCLVSIVESYAALSQVVGKQGLYYPLVKHCLLLGSGFLILWGLQRLHYTKYIPFIKVFSGLVFISVIAVLFIGNDVNGAMRAIPVPGLGTIQPAELSKLAIATLVPLIVSRNQVENGVTRRGAILAVTVGCAFALFLVGQGLTHTILLLFIDSTFYRIYKCRTSAWRNFFISHLLPDGRPRKPCPVDEHFRVEGRHCLCGAGAVDRRGRRYAD